MAEHYTVNVDVVGSSPAVGACSKYANVAQWQRNSFVTRRLEVQVLSLASGLIVTAIPGSQISSGLGTHVPRGRWILAISV